MKIDSVETLETLLRINSCIQALHSAIEQAILTSGLSEEEFISRMSSEMDHILKNYPSDPDLISMYLLKFPESARSSIACNPSIAKMADADYKKSEEYAETIMKKMKDWCSKNLTGVSFEEVLVALTYGK